MIKGLLKGIAYTAGFVVLGGIGVSLIAHYAESDYPLEWVALLYILRKSRENNTEEMIPWRLN